MSKGKCQSFPQNKYHCIPLSHCWQPEMYQCMGYLYVAFTAKISIIEIRKNNTLEDSVKQISGTVLSFL